MRAAPWVVAGLAALAGCIAAVAFAASPQRNALPAPEPGRAMGRALQRPSLGRHPNRVSVSALARFTFTVRGNRARFQCRLDRRAWNRCHSPVRFAGLRPGDHRFAVRTVGPHGSHGASARFRWRVLSPRGFTIAPRLPDLGGLYPGAPALPIPLTLSNQNPVPIFVTRLAVSSAAGPPGCQGDENLALTGAGVSSSAPLEVPAKSSVNLPAPGVAAPTIQLRNLPVDQDACQGASFPLSFSGSARG
jgi:hypothetical protein